MWNKIILREKIAIVSESLKEKLFFLNDSLRTSLLSIRSNIADVEDLRIISYQKGQFMDNDRTVSLDAFSRTQKKNREKIKEKIALCSSLCRD